MVINGATGVEQHRASIKIVSLVFPILLYSYKAVP